MDVADPAAPRYLGPLPEPRGSFGAGPLRYGPHNLHENRAGSYRSGRLVFGTYFSAGVRVYDVADPAAPREVGYWLPEPPGGQAAAQSNDLFVEESGRIWVTDRLGGGVTLLEPDAGLAELMDRSRDS